MGKLAKKYCSFSIVTADNSRGENLSEIISDILEGFDETDKRQVITDRKKAIEYAIVNADENDVIIVAGKGCENYIIDKDGKHYFNEKEIIEDAFLKREEIYENRIKNSTFI